VELRVGIVVCEANARRSCPGTSCFLAVKGKVGEFSQYGKVELVGFTTCGGCPVPKYNLEKVELLLNRGAEAIHFGNCVRDCPHLDNMEKEVEQTYPDLKVIVGTHPAGSGGLGWTNIKDKYKRVISKKTE